MSVVRRARSGISFFNFSSNSRVAFRLIPRRMDFRILSQIMLDRNIDVAAEFCVFLKRFNNILRKFCRICIHQSNPFDSIYAVQLAKKFRKLSFVIQIQSIVCRILRNDNEFLYSFFGKQLCFVYKFFHRPAAMFSPHEWNGAKRTGIVASFGDF